MKAGSARTNAKKGQNKEVKIWKKKRIEAQRAKPRTPTPAIDAFIGKEEQTGKKKRSIDPFVGSPPTTRSDHTVSLFLQPSRHTERKKKTLKPRYILESLQRSLSHKLPSA